MEFSELGLLESFVYKECLYVKVGNNRAVNLKSRVLVSFENVEITKVNVMTFKELGLLAYA